MLRSLRRAVQAAADQAGRHPGWRGQGTGQPQAAWGGGAQSEHNLSVTDKSIFIWIPSADFVPRFESLTLSHNNMIALKPVLLAWLEEAEAARRDPEGTNGLLPTGEKKRDVVNLREIF